MQLYERFAGQMRTAVVMDGCIFACVALVECISTGKPVASANFSNAMVNQSMVSSKILTLICYLIIGLSSGNLLAKTISLIVYMYIISLLQLGRVEKGRENLRFSDLKFFLQTSNG